MNINIDIPNFDLPNSYIPAIDIPDFDLPNSYIPDINPPNFSTDNSTILEITNTQDTNIIDESDGLSLGEAIEIANNDPENNYIIEIPGGSTYTATLDENLPRPIGFRSTGEGIAEVNITSSNSINQLTLQGESVVVLGNSRIDNDNNNINSDSEALTLNGETAQIAYVAYYGRPAAPDGVNFWNQALTDDEVSYSPRRGDPLTGEERDIYDRLVNQFGDSPEADRLFAGLSNQERVDLVYQFAFDRDADEDGQNYWTEQLDRGNVTLANFALEVALGAQGEDIVTLNNKIESANLFSDSLDTEVEINAYSGSSAEVFGREWLDNFGETV
ncbi:MAG: DUF4214 domain-containing protein [Xenococcaceae cyanobacterium]